MEHDYEKELREALASLDDVKDFSRSGPWRMDQKGEGYFVVRRPLPNGAFLEYYRTEEVKSGLMLELSGNRGCYCLVERWTSDNSYHFGIPRNMDEETARHIRDASRK